MFFGNFQPSDFGYFKVLGTSTIRFSILQRFMQLQPSDFEHFNVLGNSSTIRFCVVRCFLLSSTIRFCILQRFRRSSTIRFWALQCFTQLQPLDFEFFSVLGFFWKVFWHHQILRYFKVLGDFNHQILRSSLLQCLWRLQPSDFPYFKVN